MVRKLIKLGIRVLNREKWYKLIRIEDYWLIIE